MPNLTTGYSDHTHSLSPTESCHMSRKSGMRDIQKDYSHTIHLLHIPDISYHISPEDAASSGEMWHLL